MTIRRAIPEDFKDIYSLSRELGYDLVDQKIAHDRIDSVMLSQNDELWVCDDEGILKGWIHYFVAIRVASPSFVEIGGLVVSSSYRRQGIGRNLVMKVIADAEKREMKLRVRCNAKRKETHQFYNSLCFSEAKEQKVFEYL